MSKSYLCEGDMTSADVPNVGVVYDVVVVGVQEWGEGVERPGVTHGNLENWTGEMIPDPLFKGIRKKKRKRSYNYTHLIADGGKTLCGLRYEGKKLRWAMYGINKLTCPHCKAKIKQVKGDA